MTIEETNIINTTTHGGIQNWRMRIMGRKRSGWRNEQIEEEGSSILHKLRNQLKMPAFSKAFLIEQV